MLNTLNIIGNVLYYVVYLPIYIAVNVALLGLVSPSE